MTTVVSYAIMVAVSIASVGEYCIAIDNRDILDGKVVWGMFSKSDHFVAVAEIRMKEKVGI